MIKVKLIYYISQNKKAVELQLQSFLWYLYTLISNFILILYRSYCEQTPWYFILYCGRSSKYANCHQNIKCKGRHLVEMKPFSYSFNLHISFQFKAWKPIHIFVSTIFSDQSIHHQCLDDFGMNDECQTFSK